MQKSALAIILSPNYTSYEYALKMVKFESLKIRREKLSLSFARKSLKTHPHWYVEDTKSVNTRRKTTDLKNVTTRTIRFRKSAIQYLTSLINQHG